MVANPLQIRPQMPSERARTGFDDLGARLAAHPTASGQQAFYRGDGGRGAQIRTAGLVVPNDALYQAELHPGCGAPSASSTMGFVFGVVRFTSE